MAAKKKKKTPARKTQGKKKVTKAKQLAAPQVIKVSCSGVPRFFDCASSAIVSDAPFNPGNVGANLGDAVHDGAARHVLDQPVDLDELAERFNIEDKTDLRVCMAYVRQAWKAVASHFPSAKVEQRIESDLVNGTADVLHHDGDTAAVLDWKSGRVPTHVTEQLASYAYAVREKFGMPRSGYITTISVWLRFSEMDVRRMDDAYLDQFAEVFKQQMKSAGRQYAPSYDACGFCLRQNECKARQDFINAAGVSLVSLEDRIDALTVDQLGELYGQVKLVEKAVEAYKSALKMMASKHGQVLIGNGKAYRVQEYRKEVIGDVQETWKHLVQHQGFTPEDMASITKLSLTKAKQIVSDRVEHGDKAKAKAQLMNDLAEAKCTRQIPYTKAVVVKAKEGA